MILKTLPTYKDAYTYVMGLPAEKQARMTIQREDKPAPGTTGAAARRGWLVIDTAARDLVEHHDPGITKRKPRGPKPDSK